MTKDKRDICVRYGLRTRKPSETANLAIKRACVVFGYLDPIVNYDPDTGAVDNITFTPANTNTPY